MFRIVATLALVLPSCLIGISAAQGGAEVKTLMTEPGKLLHREKLSAPFAKEWTANKGKWEVVAGALRGAELKADMHGAVRRLPLPFTGAIIQYDFKLDGARQTTLSINAAKGHVCRVLIRPDGFVVQKDKDKKTDEKAAVLGRCQVAIAPGEWHTLTVELLGKEMLASLDGKNIAFGAHPGIDVPKANLGLTVAGESVSFRNLSVWEALPNRTWDATRARLQKTRQAEPTSAK
jgi:hypothetical protein